MLMMWPRRRDHVGQGQLTAGDHAVEVDLDRRANRLLGLLEERPDRHDTRVVDQHVDVAAAVRAGLVQERRERLAIGDVERVTRCRAEIRELGDRRLLKGHVTITDDHSCAALEQSFGGGVADAPRGTGDGDRSSADVIHATELYTCQVCRERGGVERWAMRGGGWRVARCRRLGCFRRRTPHAVPRRHSFR